MDPSPGGSGATAPLQPALAPWHGREGGERRARAGRRAGGCRREGGERRACGSAWKKREKELKGEGKKGKEKR